MSVTRLSTGSDAVYARAWVCDTTAERTALLATFGSPQGPKRGDMILDNETGQLYLVTNGANNVQISGLVDSPVDLNSDVTGVLPTANGGTSVDIAGAALPLGSGQITFPATQNPSSNANTLDDYEEGTWTPVLAFGGASVGITYANQAGTYIKIGRFVACCGLISLSSKGSSTGAAAINGLPITMSSAGVGAIMGGKTVYSDFTAGVHEVGFQGGGGGGNGISVNHMVGVTNTIATDVEFTNGSALIMYFCYFADA